MAQSISRLPGPGEVAVAGPHDPVLRLTLSRTSTRPLLDVDLRAVAAVLDAPARAADSRRRVAPAGAERALGAAEQPPHALLGASCASGRSRRVARQAHLNEEPVSRMSVMSDLDRRLIRACWIRKRPRKNWPVWVLRPVVAALRIFTRPRLVSSVAPTGIVSAPSSRTKPLGGLACDVPADPLGSFTNTSPETTVALTVLNGRGRCGAVVVVAAVLDPVLVGVGRAARVGSARRRARGDADRPGLLGGVVDRVGRARGRHVAAGGAVGVPDGTAVGAGAVAEQPRNRGEAGPVVVGGGRERQRARCPRPGARGR